MMRRSTSHWTPVSQTVSQQHLRSAASHQLTVPSHRRVTYGGRAFAVAGPSTWNSLPKRLRDPSNSTSVFLVVISKHLFLRLLLEALTRMRYTNGHLTLYYGAIRFRVKSCEKNRSYDVRLTFLAVLLEVRSPYRS